MKKLVSLILVIVSLAVCFVGCTDKNDNDKKDKKEKSQDSSMADTTAKTSTKITEATVEKTEPAQTTQSKAPAEVKANSTWSDFKVKIDDVDLAVPFSYDKLKSTGWGYNLAESGYPDGYVMNPKDKTYGTTDIYHATYKKDSRSYDIYATAGSINLDTKAKDITQCDIWCFTFDATSAIKKGSPYPKVVLESGITWGSTKADVEKAYGTPKETFRSEDLAYDAYTYVDSNYNQIKFNIYDKYGVTLINMENTKKK